MSRTPAFDEAYPPELWEQERRFLSARRGTAVSSDRPPDDAVGVALSGGGIRSATFCLGVFQALARADLVRRIDYLSTVSGGGYFGSFLGRLFTRAEVGTAEDVRALLDPEAAPNARPAGIPDAIRWLRENGRYLSPNGAGDLLLGAAILLRNWATVHTVLLGFVLLILLGGQLPRLVLEAAAWSPRLTGLVGCGPACGPSWLWWSPWRYVAAAMLVWWSAPLGWAYWLTGRWRRRSIIEWPACGLGAALAVALAALVLGRGSPWRLGGAAAILVVTLTVVCWGAALTRARQTAAREGEGRVSRSRTVFEIDEQRNLLSRWLTTALMATGGVLGLAVLDSIGQTFYLVAMQPDQNLFTYLFGALSGVAAVAAFAKRMATALGGRPNGRRLGLPLSTLAWVAALAIIAVLLIATSVLSHGIAWGFRLPEGAPAISWALPARDVTAQMHVNKAPSGQAAVTIVVDAPTAGAMGEGCVPQSRHCPRSARALLMASITWGVILLFGWLFGRSWPFLNQSSLNSMYSARLTRAYLGASNPLRMSGEGTVTRVRLGDNIDPAEYWAPPVESGRDPKARPLHLINVTINETMDGQSQVQQQDRKGTGLAIGPCAFTVGVRHHAVFPDHETLARSEDLTRSAARVFPSGGSAFRVFEGIDERPWTGGERLSIGTWAGISGAAFSTGMGARTSLGLSLLCGFGNVRLGYWWDSRVRRTRRLAGARSFFWLERLFPVQIYLLSEFLSRFYGTSRPRWYLSDGGHFENMGAYELIRRRLSRILLVDAEADPDYTFEGLANLVRKARLDFGAEVTFLTPDELTAEVPDPPRALFGSLEQLRRGKWGQEPVREALTGRRRRSIEDPVDLTRPSLAHAALARIRYVDEPDRECWLLYLKPTMIGDEPADLVQYHRAHPTFPQETTADQFFDEAQWESYRMLGYHIAGGVLGIGPSGTAPTSAGTPSSPRERLFGP